MTVAVTVAVTVAKNDGYILIEGANLSGTIALETSEQAQEFAETMQREFSLRVDIVGELPEGVSLATQADPNLR